MASGSTANALLNEKSGNSGTGRLDGMPPNRVPIVSTGKAKNVAIREHRTTAIRIPGQDGRHRRCARITNTVNKDSATAAGVMEPADSARTVTFGTKADGSLATRESPKKSLI